MKILFLGMGSIGQRHIQNIKSLFGKEMELYSVRLKAHNLLIKNGEAYQVKNLNDYYEIKEVFKTLDEALNKFRFDAVFITNPSSMHAEAILKCLDYNINIFVEKPMCTSYQDALKIESKLRKCNCILYVGYQSHFDPIYQKTKNLISKNKLGNTVTARFEWCTYLPDHHKYEDYRFGYAAKKNLGGGVLLGLSHELDIILNLFGKPNSIIAIEAKNKKLNIEAEDTIMAVFEYANELNQFPLSIVLSYSQVFETRSFKIQCENGFIDCDWVSRKLKIINQKTSEKFSTLESNISRNDIFKIQIKYFFDCIKNKDKSLNNISSSMNVLSIINSLKRKLDRN